jgi:murein DD-endopeptidase MepM/ murein hydrolase activator NlpD
MRRILVLVGGVAVAVVVALGAHLLTGLTSPARAATESSLAARAAAEAQQLSAVSGDLAGAQQRLALLDADVSARKGQLAATEAQLAKARSRLVLLRLRVEIDQHTLAGVLAADYRTDPPDLVTVVLEAKGFADLLERLDGAKRVAEANARTVQAIRIARERVAAQTRLLNRLQRRQQSELEAVVAREEAAAIIRTRLADQKLAIDRAHAKTVGQLHAVQARRRALQARLAATQNSAARALTPPKSQVLSGGGFTFPMPAGAAVSPSSWSLDQGVDIAAPGNTPLLAVGSGTIIGHGIGGFGSDAPILRLDDGRMIYYGHAGPGNRLPTGTHVRAGETISEVGAGIVGISTGPHLEIGFCDSNGTPSGPQTAPTMMALLRAAYGG